MVVLLEQVVVAEEVCYNYYYKKLFNMKLCKYIFNLSFFYIMPIVFFFISNIYAAGAPENSISESNSNAKIYIVSPIDGATVDNQFKVIFGHANVDIVPAGVQKEFSGHHHLLIDVEELPDLSRPIPSNENYIHYGKGQTETELNLPKGSHSLQLLLGDYLHTPHSKPLYSKKIHINVK